MHPLSQKIWALQNRLLVRRRMIAICWIAATVLAAAILLGVADYFVQFADRGLRVIATSLLIAAAGWSAYRWWYVPSRDSLAPLKVARRIESRFPQLGDSLASAVEFLEQSENDASAGSAQLRRQVIAAAQMSVDGLSLEEVIDRRPLRRAAAWLGIAALVLAVCLVVDVRAVGTALMRLAAPLGSTEWPRTNHLAFRDPPTRIAAGDTFEVELIDASGALPDEVRIEYRSSLDGRRVQESENMTRVGDMMVARRENVGRSFSFRAAGGDDDTMAWHDVDVVEPPRLETFELVAHPPRYTGISSVRADRHLEVLVGTEIEARGTASEPLRAARIIFDGGQAFDAKIGPDEAREDSAFHLEPGKWQAKKSGAYRVELTDAEGVSGLVGQWNLRVEPDPTPNVEWRSPKDDVYVTAAAIVPIEIAVSDNLAIKEVDLVIRDTLGSQRASQIGNQGAASAAENEPAHEAGAAQHAAETPSPARPDRRRLFQGPSEAPGGGDAEEAERGDNRVIDYELSIAEMNLTVGAQRVLEAEASDYRPAIGRTIAPRRITIISQEDLEGRLANRQNQIVRQLERALTVQRSAREDERRLEILHRDTGRFGENDRNSLQAVELNQRLIGRMLVDRVEGVPALVEALIAELDMNRLPASEIRAAMRNLSDVLDRLAVGSLATAERELTAARKSAESIDVGDSQTALSRSLAAIAAAQEEVIAEVERLQNELAESVDIGRIARQLSELRQDQLAHEKTTRAEIGLNTLPLDVDGLSRTQRAALNAAAAGQGALARRYEKIEQALDAVARGAGSAGSSVTGTFADAVALAQQLTIAGDMQEARQDLAANRVGVALECEVRIIDSLQQVLDVLRGRSEQKLDRLVEQLRQAESRLAKLREQLAGLRQQIERAEQQGAATNPRDLQRLKIRQEQLRQEAEQLARQLRRLQADDAGRSTESAGNRLGDRPQDGAGNDDSPPKSQQRPSSSNSVRQAEKDLEEAARQLARRREQAEFDLALEFVRRFQADLTAMIQRQQNVIRDTTELDRARRPNAQLEPVQLQKLRELAAEEHELSHLAVVHGELLVGLGAVRESLEDASRRLSAAGMLLEGGETGPPAQQAESHALVRLQGMLDAFKQTAAEANPNPPGGGAAGTPNAPQRRPTFELLEVKMLRMLQVDLNERTQAYQERLAAIRGPLDERAEAELREKAGELAAEQRRLAGLVEEMLTRDNKKRQEE